MKLQLTEGQLKRLIKKINTDIEEQTGSEPSPSPSSTSGSGTGSKEGYPEVGKWKLDIVRDAANQTDPKSKWSDVVGSKLKRSKANMLK